MNNPKLRVSRSADVERGFAQAHPPVVRRRDEDDDDRLWAHRVIGYVPQTPEPVAQPVAAQPIVRPPVSVAHIPTLAEAEAAIVAAQKAIDSHIKRLAALESKLESAKGRAQSAPSGSAARKSAAKRSAELESELEFEQNDRPGLDDALRAAQGLRLLAQRAPEVAAWRQHVADLAVAREQVTALTQQLQKAVAHVKNLENSNYNYQSQQTQFYARAQKLGISDQAINEFYNKVNQSTKEKK